MKKIAIIGGGISGLAAAYELQERGKGDFEISLFEASPRLGGVIETKNQDGVLLEAGPDCFLSKKPEALELCQEIGLSQEIISTREGFRRSFIYSRKKMHAMPTGFYLMAPGKISTLLKMSILSIFGKIRAGFDLLIPRRQNEGDESVAGFMKRRLGREVFEKVGQPMIGGIYGGDPAKISLRATVPQFEEMEKKYGSVIKGLRKQQDEAHETASGPRYSLFLSMKQGMEEMVRGLAQDLMQVKIYTACAIQEIRLQGPAYYLKSSDGREIEADAVVLALPAYEAAKLMRPFASELSQQLDSIPYESIATVNLVYKKSEVPSFNGIGFVVPKVEGTKISACTFSSQKFEGRTSEDMTLLRVFVGGALYPEEFRLDDGAMEAMVKEELEKILGITASPQIVSIRRYPRAMPQYEVGHLEKVAGIQRQLKNFPGLFLTGNAYEGIGIPDCIAQARRQAQALAVSLGV